MTYDRHFQPNPRRPIEVLAFENVQLLGADLAIPDIARRAGMSDRTFLRRYREATGVTPAKALERLRVEAAQRQLCESREPVKRIAMRCGFGSEDTMRRSFLRIAGVSPKDYRRRFSP